MYRVITRIGDHFIRMHTESEDVCNLIQDTYHVLPVECAEEFTPHMDLSITWGYGREYTHAGYEITQHDGRRTYKRMDYVIDTDDTFTEAEIRAYNAFSLRHAMMNLYSAFIVHQNYGLLVHSSCVIERDGAYLFSGYSGAGKSTVARLSSPRALLSDEATIVRVNLGSIDVLDSPFRSETRPHFFEDAYPLRAIHLLTQSQQILRRKLDPAEAIMHLMDKVFFWACDSSETRNVLRLYRTILASVPVYELEFQKNNRFWEAIS